jgi:hypothetical protein
MKVLVACEVSGIVRDSFKKLGFDAWSCDTQPTQKEGNHIQDDVLNVLGNNWDMMIAHPPCTYLSKAGARWLYQGGLINEERYEKGLKAKEFFLKLLNADIPKIAVENPIPLTIFNLPKPSHYVQPYEYGHKYSKKTLLWLKNLQPLFPTCIYSKYEPFLPSNTGGKKKGWKYTIKKVDNKNYSNIHSKTFEGIAKAMANQWGSSAII